MFIPDRRNLKSCRRPAGLHSQQIYSEISLKVAAANIAARGEIVIPGRPVGLYETREMRCDFAIFGP
jgi:hypothetical protein